MSKGASAEVRIFEVAPRDGLQNESAPIPLDSKLELIAGLAAAGLRDLEVGAFVRSDRVPQMGDTEAIYEAMRQGRLELREARAWALVPNRKGLERALAAGARQIAVFTAATETFARRNIGMSIDESLEEFREVISLAKGHRVRVRGYVSTAFGCPFEGKVPPSRALRVIDRLARLEVDQISIGDTIGVATPNQMDEVLKPALRGHGPERVAAHLHDTRGTALANALRALELGVRTLDSSAGGLGGCPFAPGAAGNLATEDLVYMLDGMGVRTGVSLEALSQASLKLIRSTGRPIRSRYLQAYAHARSGEGADGCAAPEI
jgi:hydroxymethylglutaryl-CoA lyase